MPPSESHEPGSGDALTALLFRLCFLHGSLDIGFVHPKSDDCSSSRICAGVMSWKEPRPGLEGRLVGGSGAGDVGAPGCSAAWACPNGLSCARSTRRRALPHTCRSHSHWHSGCSTGIRSPGLFLCFRMRTAFHLKATETGPNNKGWRRNRRPALALNAERELGSAAHDSACLSGGGRSALS